MRTAVVVVFAASVAATAHAQPAATGALQGVVMRGPVTPVCRVGDPCAKPAAGVTLVFSRDGSEVARTKTSLRGRYRIALRGGWYAVRALPLTRIGRGISPGRVRVVAGRTRTVDFALDTGIR